MTEQRAVANSPYSIQMTQDIDGVTDFFGESTHPAESETFDYAFSNPSGQSQFKNSGSAGDVFSLEMGERASHIVRIEGSETYFKLDITKSDESDPTLVFGDVRDLFRIDESLSEIGQFFADNPELVYFVRQTHDAMRKIFRTEQFYLEFVEDPAGPSGNALSITAEVSDPPAIALKRLELFDNEWWKNHRRLSEYKISVDIRF